MKKLLTAISLSVAATAFVHAQVPGASSGAKESPPKPAVPVRPIPAILDTFRSHPIVAIGDPHGNEQVQAFRLALIRNPQFAATVNDIVVEFGNARYQDLMDRFVRGEDVPHEPLRQVWQNTTQPEYDWDLPIYEAFFQAVRGVNATLPRERQLRVLLGDPPIDWAAVRTEADLRVWLEQRDRHAVEVIRKEVLAKGRRALVIYGDQHLIRKNSVMGAADEWARGLIAQLERPAIASVFTIHPETRTNLAALQPDAASWPIPSFALVRGTVLGASVFEPSPQKRPVRTEEQFDAILYLGPPSAMTASQLAPALCSDRNYMEMRLSRLAMIAPPPGAPISPADRLKEYCTLPAGNSPVQDVEPNITALVRDTIRDAALGKVDLARLLAPEARERESQFLQENGPRFLGSAGRLESLTLLVDSHDSGKHIRRYRSVFGNGERVLWTVELSSAGKIVSMDPQPE